MPISNESLLDVSKLMKICFPKTRFTREYLQWLYFENPSGNVAGFNLLKQGELIGHYACIPTNIAGRQGYLSLNTATHPNSRGQGVFKLLAKETFDQFEREKTFVVGVANQNSIDGFIKHLDFKHLGNLELRLGQIKVPTKNSRIWTNEDLEWKKKSLKNRIEIKAISKSINLIKLRIPFPPYFLFALTRTTIHPDHKNSEYFTKVGFTVDWSRNHRAKLKLPKALKPSPLNLILRDFSEENLGSTLNSWSFVDFDAF